MEEKNNKPRKDFKSKGKFGGKKFGGKKFGGKKFGGKKFGEKKFGGRGKSFGKDKPDFKKRKLAPGVEFVDREKADRGRHRRCFRRCGKAHPEKEARGRLQKRRLQEGWTS